ncbi:hypothetical protein AGMMS50249_2230 [candidate division SR1 bacterium]|nr:hypothetical protein AGMMS50249_2230 [candidate division SR1 bacterium]
MFGINSASAAALSDQVLGAIPGLVGGLTVGGGTTTDSNGGGLQTDPNKELPLTDGGIINNDNQIIIKTAPSVTKSHPSSQTSVTSGGIIEWTFSRKAGPEGGLITELTDIYLFNNSDLEYVGIGTCSSKVKVTQTSPLILTTTELNANESVSCTIRVRVKNSTSLTSIQNCVFVSSATATASQNQGDITYLNNNNNNIINLGSYLIYQGLPTPLKQNALLQKQDVTTSESCDPKVISYQKPTTTVPSSCSKLSTTTPQSYSSVENLAFIHGNIGKNPATAPVFCDPDNSALDYSSRNDNGYDSFLEGKGFYFGLKMVKDTSGKTTAMTWSCGGKACGISIAPSTGSTTTITGSCNSGVYNSVTTIEQFEALKNNPNTQRCNPSDATPERLNTGAFSDNNGGMLNRSYYCKDKNGKQVSPACFKNIQVPTCRSLGINGYLDYRAWDEIKNRPDLLCTNGGTPVFTQTTNGSVIDGTSLITPAPNGWSWNCKDSKGNVYGGACNLQIGTPPGFTPPCSGAYYSLLYGGYTGGSESQADYEITKSGVLSGDKIIRTVDVNIIGKPNTGLSFSEVSTLSGFRVITQPSNFTQNGSTFSSNALTGGGHYQFVFESDAIPGETIQNCVQRSPKVVIKADGSLNNSLEVNNCIETRLSFVPVCSSVVVPSISEDTPPKCVINNMTFNSLQEWKDYKRGRRGGAFIANPPEYCDPADAMTGYIESGNDISRMCGDEKCGVTIKPAVCNKNLESTISDRMMGSNNFNPFEQIIPQPEWCNPASAKLDYRWGGNGRLWSCDGSKECYAEPPMGSRQCPDEKYNPYSGECCETKYNPDTKNCDPTEVIIKKDPVKPIKKSLTTGPVSLGDTVSWEITWTAGANGGSADDWKESIPSYLGDVKISCSGKASVGINNQISIPDLKPGETVKCTITATVISAPNNGKILNCVVREQTLPAPLCGNYEGTCEKGNPGPVDKGIDENGAQYMEWQCKTDDGQSVNCGKHGAIDPCLLYSQRELMLHPECVDTNDVDRTDTATAIILHGEVEENLSKSLLETYGSEILSKLAKLVLGDTTNIEGLKNQTLSDLEKIKNLAEETVFCADPVNYEKSEKDCDPESEGRDPDTKSCVPMRCSALNGQTFKSCDEFYAQLGKPNWLCEPASASILYDAQDFCRDNNSNGLSKINTWKCGTQTCEAYFPEDQNCPDEQKDKDGKCCPEGQKPNAEGVCEDVPDIATDPIKCPIPGKEHLDIDDPACKPEVNSGACLSAQAKSPMTEAQRDARLATNPVLCNPASETAHWNPTPTGREWYCGGNTTSKCSITKTGHNSADCEDPAQQLKDGTCCVLPQVPNEDKTACEIKEPLQICNNGAANYPICCDAGSNYLDPNGISCLDTTNPDECGPTDPRRSTKELKCCPVGKIPDAQGNCNNFRIPEGGDTQRGKREASKSGNVITRELLFKALATKTGLVFEDILPATMTGFSVFPTPPATSLPEGLHYEFSGNVLTITIDELLTGQEMLISVSGEIVTGDVATVINNCLGLEGASLSGDESDDERFGELVKLVGVHMEDATDNDRNDAELCFIGQSGSVIYSGNTIRVLHGGILDVEIQRAAARTHDYQIIVKRSDGTIGAIYSGNTFGDTTRPSNLGHYIPAWGQEHRFDYARITVESGDTIEVNFPSFRYGKGDLLNGSLGWYTGHPTQPVHFRFPLGSKIQPLQGVCRNLQAKPSCASSDGEFVCPIERQTPTGDCCPVDHSRNEQTQNCQPTGTDTGTGDGIIQFTKVATGESNGLLQSWTITFTAISGQNIKKTSFIDTVTGDILAIISGFSDPIWLTPPGQMNAVFTAEKSGKDVIFTLDKMNSGQSVSVEILTFVNNDPEQESEILNCISPVVSDDGHSEPFEVFSCAIPQPSYPNATFTAGTPTSANQPRVKGASSCGFECMAGWTGATCSDTHGMPEERDIPCAPKPSTGTVRNVGSTWHQINGLPALQPFPTMYQASGSSQECSFHCAIGYHLEGANTCVEDITPPSNSCAIPQPSYPNATFTAGTPTSANQPRVKGASSCGFECASGWTGADCNTTIQTSITVCDTTVACDTADISITLGGKVYTMKSCNVGASTAGLGVDSYGCQFQRGNNYGFSNTGNIKTKNGISSSNLINVAKNLPSQTTYDTFVFNNSARFDKNIWSFNSNNLWGGTHDGLDPTKIFIEEGTGTDIDRRGPCPSGYHVPSMKEWLDLMTARAADKGVTCTQDHNLYSYITCPSIGANFQQYFKLPFAGFRYNDGDYYASDGYSPAVFQRGLAGYYRSSSPDYRFRYYYVEDGSCKEVNGKQVPQTYTYIVPNIVPPAGTKCNPIYITSQARTIYQWTGYILGDYILGTDTRQIFNVGMDKAKNNSASNGGHNDLTIQDYDTTYGASVRCFKNDDVYGGEVVFNGQVNSAGTQLSLDYVPDNQKISGPTQIEYKITLMNTTAQPVTISSLQNTVPANSRVSSADYDHSYGHTNQGNTLSWTNIPLPAGETMEIAVVVDQMRTTDNKVCMTINGTSECATLASRGATPPATPSSQGEPVIPSNNTATYDTTDPTATQACASITKCPAGQEPDENGNCQPIGTSDLSYSKTVRPGYTQKIGDKVVWTLTRTNNGEDTEFNKIFFDKVGDSSFTIKEISAHFSDGELGYDNRYINPQTYDPLFVGNYKTYTIDNNADAIFDVDGFDHKVSMKIADTNDGNHLTFNIGKMKKNQTFIVEIYTTINENAKYYDDGFLYNCLEEVEEHSRIDDVYGPYSVYASIGQVCADISTPECGVGYKWDREGQYCKSICNPEIEYWDWMTQKCEPMAMCDASIIQIACIMETDDCPDECKETDHGIVEFSKRSTIGDSMIDGISWYISFTARGGDVDNVVFEDVLPDNLTFSSKSSMVEEPFNRAIGDNKFSNYIVSGQTITFNIVHLSSGQMIEGKLHAKLNKNVDTTVDTSIQNCISPVKNPITARESFFATCGFVCLDIPNGAVLNSDKFSSEMEQFCPEEDPQCVTNNRIPSYLCTTPITATYNPIDNNGECTFRCDTANGYVWDGSQCKIEEPFIPEDSRYPGCDTDDIHVGNYVISACNIGASVAGVGTTSYGSYFQWGNNYPFPTNGNIAQTFNSVNASSYGPNTIKGYYSSSSFHSFPTNRDSSNNLNLWGGSGDTKSTRGAGTDADRQGPCADGYHVPSISEWQGILTAGGWGYNSQPPYGQITAKATDVFNALKLPIAGQRISYASTNGNNPDIVGSVSYTSTLGGFWSSSPSSSEGNSYSMSITKDPSVNIADGATRNVGLSVRCFKNDTSLGGEVVYDGEINGIYYDTSLFDPENPNYSVQACSVVTRCADGKVRNPVTKQCDLTTQGKITYLKTIDTANTAGDIISWDVSFTAQYGNITQAQQFLDEVAAGLEVVDITDTSTSVDFANLSRTKAGNKITFTVNNLSNNQTVTARITTKVVSNTSAQIENCLSPVGANSNENVAVQGDPAYTSSDTSNELSQIGFYYEDWSTENGDRNDVGVCIDGDAFVRNGGQTPVIAKFNGTMTVNISRAAASKHDYEIVIQNTAGVVKQIYTGSSLGNSAWEAGKEISNSTRQIPVMIGDRISVNITKIYGGVRAQAGQTLSNSRFMESRRKAIPNSCPSLNQIKANSFVASASALPQQSCASIPNPLLAGKLTINKSFLDSSVLQNGVNSGDMIGYKIQFANNTSVPVSNASIRDTLPSTLKYISSEFYLFGVKQPNLPKNANTNPLIRDGLNVGAGQSGYIILTGQVISVKPGDTTNMACFRESTNPTDCSSTGFTYEKVLDIKKEAVIPTTGIKSGDTVTYKLTIENRGNNGQTSFNVYDTLPAGMAYKSNDQSANFDFDSLNPMNLKWGVYKQTLGPGQKIIITYTVQITTTGTLTNTACVLAKDAPDTQKVCKSVTIIVPDDTDTCPNGAINPTDTPPCTKCSANSIMDNNVCKACPAGQKPNTAQTACEEIQRECPAGQEKVNGDCKKLTCISTYTSGISINRGEIFPFYGDIGVLFDDGYGNYNIENGQLLSGNPTVDSDCSTAGAIARDSIKCNYQVFNQGDSKQGDTPYYNITVPCFTTELDSPILTATKASRGTSPRKTSIYLFSEFGSGTSILPNTNVNHASTRKSTDKTLGEYKLSLKVTEYKKCDPDKKNRKLEQDVDVCESNFTLTEPYIIQKTPAGNLETSVEILKRMKLNSAISIPNFTGKDAETLVNTVLEHGAAVEQTTEESKAMESFISKYSKLAVKLSGTKFGLSKGISKVPSQEIYFASGDMTLTGTSSDLNKVVTIIQTTGNITVVGNISTNVMLLTKGTITFKSSDCDKQQQVKGIFYAKDGFKSSGDLRNTDLSKENRCEGGNLKVQGILLTKDNSITSLESLYKNRRSELNQWFTADPNASIATRQGYVMNGASLLIEYSPSIFESTTMAPGTKDFTNSLSVFKNK